MEIRLYYNTSDNRCIRKNLLNELSLSGTLRDSCNLIEPVLNIQNESVIRYNYAYIPDFKRYYFIKKITSLRKGLWTIEFEVDPLMSFKGDILALQVVVDKQSSDSIGDEYIDGKPYSEIVKIAKDFIDSLGGFEKFSEWGLV